jgi:hypothetical protein
MMKQRTAVCLSLGGGGNAGTKPFANGFAALKSLDSNNDNIFNNLDAAWGNVRVWVDANHDGKTDAGELKTFAELGITRINLATTSQSGLVRDGNEVLASGTFVMSGLTREALAANFLNNPNGLLFSSMSDGVQRWIPRDGKWMKCSSNPLVTALKECA